MKGVVFIKRKRIIGLPELTVRNLVNNEFFYLRAVEMGIFKSIGFTAAKLGDGETSWDLASWKFAPFQGDQTDVWSWAWCIFYDDGFSRLLFSWRSKEAYDKTQQTFKKLCRANEYELQTEANAICSRAKDSYKTALSTLHLMATLDKGRLSSEKWLYPATMTKAPSLKSVRNYKSRWLLCRFLLQSTAYAYPDKKQFNSTLSVVAIKYAS